MEEDLIKSGILKEGKIDTDGMIDSPEKARKAASNVFGFLSYIVIFIVILFIILGWWAIRSLS